MELFGCVVGFAAITAVLSASCDHLGIALYEDLGCSAHYEDSNPCPVRYSCKGLEESDKYCYFRGRAYKHQEIVNEDLADLSCDRGCTCVNYDGQSSFICAVLDCPEWLVDTVDRRDCYRKYSLSDCCSVGEVCPPFDDIAKCVVDGQEYREGEIFYPKNSSCLHCVCQKGFNGTFEEPFCRRLGCGVQLKSSGRNVNKLCAPWYLTDGRHGYCCTSNWICPDGTEDVTGEAISDDVCKFGNTTLKVGQKFRKLQVDDNFGQIVPKVECRCEVPPLLICTNAD